MSRSIEERLVRRYLRAKKHTAEFELRAARGQWRRALSANRHAVRQASRLKAEDPANPEHCPVLASLLYGQAMVLTAARAQPLCTDVEPPARLLGPHHLAAATSR
jgi:hypothetical protein